MPIRNEVHRNSKCIRIEWKCSHCCCRFDSEMRCQEHEDNCPHIGYKRKKERMKSDKAQFKTQ